MKLTLIASIIASQYGYTKPKPRMSPMTFLGAGGRLYTLRISLKGRAAP